MTVMRRRARGTLVAALALVLWQGCVTVSLREPVAGFKDGVAKASTSLGTYYAEMNRFERDLYLDERLYDPSLEVLSTDARNEPTPLLGHVFSPESIRARQDAIALLGLYAERLTELAGNESPSHLSEGSKVMGENLGKLGERLNALAGKGDSSAAKYVGPVGTLVGVVGDIFLEAKRDRALQVSIEKGAPQVRAIIDLLEADLVDVFTPQRLTGLKQGLATRVAFYNEMRGKLSLEDRKKVLDDIRRAAEQYEALLVFNPADITSALRDAHEALVSFARSDRKPRSFEEFVTVMKGFQGRIDTAAAAVQAIRKPQTEE